MSDSLWPHGLQHARPSPTLRAYSNSCPLSWRCHPTISSSVIHFSSCLQSFLASGSFQMSQFFTSGGQGIGVSASASVPPMNIQDWFPLVLRVWSPCSPKDSQESSSTPPKHQFFSPQLSLWLKTFKNILVGKRTEENRLNEPVSWIGFLRNLLHNLKEINPLLSVLESLMTPCLANTLKWGTVANVWVRISGSKWDKE